MTRHFEQIALDAIGPVVDCILEAGRGFTIWTFTGDLGTGKTTLIKALAEKLGIQDTVSSPTFNYVNTYDEKVYHFDCYRIKNSAEALNLGLEEYLDSGRLCWVEWPEMIDSILYGPRLEIALTHNSDNTRSYRLTPLK